MSDPFGCLFVDRVDKTCLQSPNDSFLEFNQKIGLPIKEGIKPEIWDYEWNLFDKLSNDKNLWIKKATGLGVTELLLRYIYWACNNKWTNSNICIVTGPRLELSITLMDRLKKLDQSKTFVTKNTVAEINGNRVEAFPSHHLDAMRGLDKVTFIFLDEADFFNPLEQDEARAISERYFGKFGSQVVMVSTPNVPDGLFDRMEREPDSRYDYVFLPYTIGMNKIYRTEDIEKAKLSPSFEREYNLKYGFGSGDIYDLTAIDQCTKEYQLIPNPSCEIEMDIDPGYGSSKFAILIWQNLNNKMQILLADQYDRPSQSQMLGVIRNYIKSFHVNKLRIDASSPELIAEFSNEISTYPQNFRETGLEMLATSARMVSANEVEIHPKFKQLLSQLRAVKRDNKNGDVDKKLLLFDLGDTFRMGCYGFKQGSGYVVIVR